MLQFSAGQSGAQLPHELRTRTADTAARRDIIHADNYTTFALLLNGKRKTKKKLIGFALLYVIVCTHYVCGVVYNVYVNIWLLLSVSEYLVSLNHGVGGVMCQGRVFQIS